jgi:hypothetical protein
VEDGLGYWDINGYNQWDDVLTFQPGMTVTNANIVLQTQGGDGNSPRRRIAAR